MPLEQHEEKKKEERRLLAKVGPVYWISAHLEHYTKTKSVPLLISRTVFYLKYVCISYLEMWLWITWYIVI